MSVEIRGKIDAGLTAIASVLELYEKENPEARISLYRFSPLSARIRIIDPGFARKTRGERNDYVWDYLDALPEDIHSEIGLVVLITPEEVGKSGSNLEFEDPVSPSWAEV